jgi:hypothetical protein
VGYYQKKNDYVLIYEYMNNGSLRDHLSGKSSLSLSSAEF